MGERTKGQVHVSVGGNFDGLELGSDGVAIECGNRSIMVVLNNEPDPAKRTAYKTADFAEASWNAADRLGLTAKQLNEGVLERLVEAAKVVAVGGYLQGDNGHVLNQSAIDGIRAALAAFDKAGEVEDGK